MEKLKVIAGDAVPLGVVLVIGCYSFDIPVKIALSYWLVGTISYATAIYEYYTPKGE